MPANIFLNIYLFKKKIFAFNLSYHIKGDKMVTGHQLKEISIIFNIFYTQVVDNGRIIKVFFVV